MKKLSFLFVVLTGTLSYTYSQWSASTISEPTYRSGFVSIGTNTVSMPLTVSHPLYSISQSGTNYIITSELSSRYTYEIPSGLTDNGYRMGLNINSHVVSANFLGTLSKQYGIRVQYGSYTGSGAGIIKNAYGIFLQGLESGSATIENKYGIYQTGENFKNYFQGNIGIGTTNLESKLHVKGEIFLEGTTNLDNGWMTNFLYYRGHSLIIGTKPGKYAHNVLELKPGGSSSGFLNSEFRMYTASDINIQNLKVEINSNGSSFFNGGNVGIGTTNPTAKLTVKGDILASKIEIKNDSEIPASDYVFNEDYNLRSLTEVEQFVKENKHLPEVPSAAEFKENGYSVGEMDDILLRKVEELTLYVIEQNKKMEEKDALINSLIQSVKTLEKEVNQQRKINQ